MHARSGSPPDDKSLYAMINGKAHWTSCQLCVQVHCVENDIANFHMHAQLERDAVMAFLNMPSISRFIFESLSFNCDRVEPL